MDLSHVRTCFNETPTNGITHLKSTLLSYTFTRAWEWLSLFGFIMCEKPRRQEPINGRIRTNFFFWHRSETRRHHKREQRISLGHDTNLDCLPCLPPTGSLYLISSDDDSSLEEESHMLYIRKITQLFNLEFLFNQNYSLFEQRT